MFYVFLRASVSSIPLQFTNDTSNFHLVLAVLAPAKMCFLCSNVFGAVIVTSCDDFIFKLVVLHFTFNCMVFDCKSSVMNNNYSSIHVVVFNMDT